MTTILRLSASVFKLIATILLVCALWYGATLYVLSKGEFVAPDENATLIVLGVLAGASALVGSSLHSRR